MLFNFMLRVPLVKMCYFKWVKCRILVCDNMVLDAEKRGGAIFGGNTVYVFQLAAMHAFILFWMLFRLDGEIARVPICKCAILS